jgi:hypothetical protein
MLWLERVSGVAASREEHGSRSLESLKGNGSDRARSVVKSPHGWSTSDPELFKVVEGLGWGRPYCRSRPEQSVAKGGDRVSREGRFSSRRWFPPGGSTAVG